MKNNNNINTYKYEYLPTLLITKINNDIFNNPNFREYRTKNNLLQAIAVLYYHQIKDIHGLNGYHPLGAQYWKTIYYGNYIKVIQPLIDLKFFETKDYGQRNFSKKNDKKGEVVTRYRINPSLLNKEHDTINYLEKESGNSIPITSEEILLNNGKSFTSIETFNNDNYISINKNIAIAWVNENASSICERLYNSELINQLPKTLSIPYHEQINNETFKKEKFLSLEAACQKAINKNLKLFYYKDNFYIADKDIFIKHRTERIKYYYSRDILKIANNPIIEKRSDKTLRIYSPLTNFPSEILKFIKINGCLNVQIDLKTSQFLLLANLINSYLNGEKLTLEENFIHDKTKRYLKRLFKVMDNNRQMLPKCGINIYTNNYEDQYKPDVKQFIYDVFYNDFYSVIKQDLDLATRDVAKSIAFKLIFRSPKSSDIYLKMLEQRYPTIMSIINEFKKDDQKIKSKKTNKKKYEKDDYNNLAVFLQCIESEIFIDKIYYPLKAEGIPCFTKHDSIVTTEPYIDEVETKLKKVFNEIGFKINTTFDYKSWELIDPIELENSGYFDSLPEIDASDIEMLNY